MSPKIRRTPLSWRQSSAAVVLSASVVASGCVGLGGLKKANKPADDGPTAGPEKGYNSYNRAVAEDAFKSMLDDDQNASLKKFTR